MMIPKTPGERIAAAEHAIRTKQYRLAHLYMNLASEELEERRIERMTPLERSFYDLMVGVSTLAKTVEKTFRETVIPTVGQIVDTVIPPLEQALKDFDSPSQNMDEHETETR